MRSEARCARRLDAMRLQACGVRPRMWIPVWGNPAKQRLENAKESEVAYVAELEAEKEMLMHATQVESACGENQI